MEQICDFFCWFWWSTKVKPKHFIATQCIAMAFGDWHNISTTPIPWTRDCLHLCNEPCLLNTSNHTLALDNSHNPYVLCSLYSRSIFPIIRWRFYVGPAIKGSEISRSHQGGICRWRNNYCSRHKILHQILASSQGFFGRNLTCDCKY